MTDQWTEAQVAAILDAGMDEAVRCGVIRRDGETDQEFHKRAFAIPWVADRMLAAGERAYLAIGEVGFR